MSLRSRHLVTVFAGLSLIVAVSFPLLSFDFGITEDELLHSRHGESILDYFLGLDARAARNPIDPSGEVVFDYDTEMNDLSGALNIYGGLFDLLSAAAIRAGSPFGPFETRHVVGSLFGVLLIVVSGLVAARIAGWRAGIVALLLLACSPRIVAHSMNNPVDLPFAALYACGILALVRFVGELPRPSAATCALLLVTIPLAASVRIAGLVLILYLAVFCLARAAGAFARSAPERDVGVWLRSTGLACLIGAAAYLLVAVPWPFAHTDPLGAPLLALRHLTRLETFNALDLFEGRWIDSREAPWYFVPKWLLIGWPVFVPLGVAAGVLVLVLGRGKAWRCDGWGASVVALAVVFPVVFVIARGSNVYNDARHLLFAYPPLAVLCAVAIDEAFRRVAARRWLAAALVAVVAASLVEPLAFMVRNHPNEGVYFSPLIGGVDGAWKRYETDYWGNSVRAGVEWIHDHVAPAGSRPVRIRLWYGDQTKAAHYVGRKPGYEFVVVGVESVEWDYEVLQTVACKAAPPWLAEWPPEGTVHEVRADGTPLSAVVANVRSRTRDEVLWRMEQWVESLPEAANLYSLARTHYRYENYEQSAAACRRAVALEPGHAEAWATLGAAAAMLGRRDEAIAACERALALAPSLDRARVTLEYVKGSGLHIIH